MKIRSLFASVRSLRFLSVALPLTALLCAAPLARAESAPAHIYLFDTVFGFSDVTATFDGASVVGPSGQVVFVSFVTVLSNGTGAGQHISDLVPTAPTNGTGAGQHISDLVPNDLTNGTGAGQHISDRTPNDLTNGTGAGQHISDRTPTVPVNGTGAGQHISDIAPTNGTGAGQHISDIMIDADNEIVGYVIE